MPAMVQIKKTPAARKKVVFEYTHALDAGVTITNLAYETETGITAGDGEVEEDGQTAFFFVSGGTSGRSYKVSLIATMSDTQILEDTISVQVKSP